MIAVTEVRIRKLTEGNYRTKAIVSISLDDELVIHDAKVVMGVRGLFVAMPNLRTSGGKQRDIVHPITQRLRDKITKAVMKAYDKAREEVLYGDPDHS